MEQQALHRRTRERGANPIVYAIVRALVTPFFLLYCRMQRLGRAHIPAEGPVIIAANHRSFFDPFAIGTMTRRRMHFVAKQELFQWPILGWLLNALGAFPVARGASDREMLETARTLLARGEIVLIFPEGTRTRPGSLGRPRRGVGRLALETGAPVVPVAVFGTEAIRRGILIRPRKVRVRAGRPLRFPRVESPSPALAAAVTERIWPCVMLQWESLGGLPPIRRAAVIGAGSAGTRLAVCLARGGLEVELGCRTAEQALRLAQTRRNDSYLPGVELPEAVRVRRASELELGGHDLICLAVPASALPAVLAAHGEKIPRRAGMLVLCRGLVPPLGTLPSAFASERCRARAVAVLAGPADAAQEAADASRWAGSLLVGSLDRGFARQLADVLRDCGLAVTPSPDVTGVELAGCAANVAALAAAAVAGGGGELAGSAAGKVFAEIAALARRRGCQPETFAGVAGAGMLLAAALAERSRSRRAGQLLAAGVPAAQVALSVGGTVEALGAVPLLAALAREARVPAPALDSLAALLEGRIEPREWAAALTAPRRPRAPAARAA
jgi:glycerol-3-phosphate dehydrogenase (NAD(P)+)